MDPPVGPRGEGDAAGLLEKAGVRGGLCLVVGAKDTALAKDLAAKSALFVQVLQGDAKLAAAGQSWWQMLPVGPTGWGNSPYSARSSFAIGTAATSWTASSPTP